MSKNYEQLYNDLKIECEQIKLDNDEICKEYELTIQMLTDSVNNFQKEKELYKIQISKLDKELKECKKEKESLMNKNKDKLIDIQDWNKENDKLKEEINKILGEKHLSKTKIISLENENDHYQNKLRQNEALIEDLSNQLESALEENITLQTEFEIYKQHNEEIIIRKEQEIKDAQNDISNKEKIIKRLNDKRASIRELKLKFQLTNDFNKEYQRNLTASVPMEYEDRKKENTDKKEQILKSQIIDENKELVTPLSNSTTKYPSKFMEIYRKSIGRGNNPFNKIVQKNENIKKVDDLANKISNVNIEDSLLMTKIPSGLSKVNTLKDDTFIEGDPNQNEKEEIDEDLNDNDNYNDNESTGSDKKCFEDLVICDEKDFTYIPIKKLMNEDKNKKDKKLVDNLKSMLALIQKRKEILINHQKMNNKKLEKLGFKIKFPQLV